MITTSRMPLHAQLRDSPLLQKLLLCHKQVYALLHSVKIAAPPNDEIHVVEVTAANVRAMQKHVQQQVASATGATHKKIC